MEENQNIEKINPTIGLKFYSKMAIYTTTFLAGPLAFGYMMWKNFKELGEKRKANLTLILVSVFTVLLFVLIFNLPDNIVERTPNYLLPVLMGAVALGLSEKYFGEILKEHKERGNAFYSVWNSIGVGFVSALPFLLMGLFYFISGDLIFGSEKSKFYKNEYETFEFYEHLDTKSDEELLKEIEINLAKWQENKQIAENLLKKESKNKNDELENQLLSKYSDLKIEAFELFKKSISEDTDRYIPELDRIHEEISQIIDKLDAIEK
ncbi:MAG: MFS transporter [Weeksellaceae bacterium]